MMNEALVEVRDTLETALSAATPGSAVKKFYAGEVGLPARNYLPAIVVRERYTELDRPSTAKDRYRFGMSILVIVNWTEDLKVAADGDDIVQHRQTLRRLVEEADSDGAPKTSTVLGALMKQSNLKGTNYTWNLNPRVDYEPALPGEFFYVAAEITLELVTEMVTRKA